MDAGWLDGVARADVKIGVTAKELASTKGADRSLTIRMLRLLASVNIVKEISPTIYAPTEMTKVFTMPGLRDGVRVASDDWAMTAAYIPQYFANTDYRSSPDATHSVFTLAQGMPLAKLLAARPDRQEAYDNFLALMRFQKRSWLDTYPIEKLKVTSSEDILFIDLAGSRGFQITDFNARRGELQLQGRLVLQDRSEVLDQIREGWQHGFTAFSHDIFAPQPSSCRHARAYYMRMVMHEWPDEACILILKHLKDAMKPGYSTLLIDDIVLPDVGCSFLGAAFDIGLMAMKSGKERTRSEWTELIGRVEGLRIDKVWPLEEGAESVLEIVRIV